MGKRRHNRIHTLIQSGICEKPQKCSEMGIFSYLLFAYHLICAVFRAHLLSICLSITYALPIAYMVFNAFTGELAQNKSFFVEILKPVRELNIFSIMI